MEEKITDLHLGCLPLTIGDELAHRLQQVVGLMGVGSSERIQYYVHSWSRKREEGDSYHWSAFSASSLPSLPSSPLRMPEFTRSSECSQVVPCLHEEELVCMPGEERRRASGDPTCFMFSHSCH